MKCADCLWCADRRNKPWCRALNCEAAAPCPEYLTAEDFEARRAWERKRWDEATRPDPRLWQRREVDALTGNLSMGTGEDD